MHTYIARQPIFNRQGHSFAYELLYRSCDEHNHATFEDNTKATVRVIANLVQNLGLSTIIGSKLGLINVDETMLFSDAILLLPKEHFYFEILEYTHISLGLCERIKYLYSLGYRFLLDDFDCSETMLKRYTPLFPYISIIKVDILAIGLTDLATAIAPLLRLNAMHLLAEKIETNEAYEACLALPFTYFQGYFFEKPLILSGRRLEPNTLNVMRLMNELQHTEETKKISDTFSSCPDVIYNLLRHLNSGAYTFRQEITNVTQMITLLGPKKLLSWLGLFIYGDTTQKPFGDELFNSAKFRAKVMEKLIQNCSHHEASGKAFLTGSLSLMDAYFQTPLEEILSQIQLDPAISNALLRHEGLLGELLWIAEEMGHSSDIDATIQSLGHHPCFPKESLYDACFEANIFVEQTNQSRKE